MGARPSGLRVILTGFYVECVVRRYGERPAAVAQRERAPHELGRDVQRPMKVVKVGDASGVAYRTIDVIVRFEDPYGPDAAERLLRAVAATAERNLAEADEWSTPPRYRPDPNVWVRRLAVDPWPAATPFSDRPSEPTTRLGFKFSFAPTSEAEALLFLDRTRGGCFQAHLQVPGRIYAENAGSRLSRRIWALTGQYGGGRDDLDALSDFAYELSYRSFVSLGERNRHYLLMIVETLTGALPVQFVILHNLSEEPPEVEELSSTTIERLRRVREIVEEDARRLAAGAPLLSRQVREREAADRASKRQKAEEALPAIPDYVASLQETLHKEGLALDLSPESLKLVDECVDEWGAPDWSGTDEERRQLVLMVSFYLGEVVRRWHGGEWRYHPYVGTYVGSIAVEVGESISFLSERWATRRFEEDEIRLAGVYEALTAVLAGVSASEEGSLTAEIETDAGVHALLEKLGW